MRTRGKATRRGFTLVELLVVIVIIAILASFLVVGVMAGMRRAKEAAIRTEIMGLAAAVEEYKQQYSHYPPSYAEERQPHLVRVHPRSGETVPADLTTSESLYFWLAGYTPNAQKPLYGVGEGRATALFDFDKDRLLPELTIDQEKDPQVRRKREYHPKGSRGIVPYVYFRKKYDATTQSYKWDGQKWGTDKFGEVLFENEILYVNEKVGSNTVKQEIARNISKDFVIISAGLEDKFTKDGLITSFQDGTKDD